MTANSDTTEILLAEDDRDDVFVFELALKEIEQPVIMKVAQDGDRLFELLKESIPDVLFLDINMPCRDGLACIIELRKNKQYDNMPVIMYTSMKDSKYIDECYRNGANFYLIKANRLQDLVENLKKIFAVNWKKMMFYPPKQQFVLS